MRLRAARPDDAEQIAPLLGQLGFPAGAEDVRRRLERLGEDLAAEVLVAHDGDRILGVASTATRHNLQRDAPTSRLTALVVDEPARRRGVGRALLEEVVTRAEREGCSRVEVTLRP